MHVTVMCLSCACHVTHVTVMCLSCACHVTCVTRVTVNPDCFFVQELHEMFYDLAVLVEEQVAIV